MSMDFHCPRYSPKESPYLSAVTPIPSASQAQASTNLLSISTDFPILDISHKGNHIICGLLCLASCT